MFYDHPLFEMPKKTNSKIWRYMDFTKLISILEKGALYFCRSDYLGDPFEGKITKMTVSTFKQSLKDSMVSEEDIEKMVLSMKSALDDYRKLMFVNCWHLSNHESAAMWKSYLKSNEGIAIQSTFRRYVEAFQNVDTSYSEFVGHIGKVKYIDYENQVINERNMFNAFLHKRKSFEYEKEIRAIVVNAKVLKNENIMFGGDREPIGFHLNCDVSKLIETIYVSPTSDEWFRSIVQSVTRKYGLNTQVKMSKLADGPLY